jgi:hypothetical protein
MTNGKNYSRTREKKTDGKTKLSFEAMEGFHNTLHLAKSEEQ